MEPKSDNGVANASLSEKVEPPAVPPEKEVENKDQSAAQVQVRDEVTSGGGQRPKGVFCGIRCEGSYVCVSGGKSKGLGAKVWSSPDNVRSDIEGALHVYFNISLLVEDKDRFLSPAVPIVLADGSPALFLALVTRTGVAASCCVSDEDRSNVRLVPPSEIGSLVEPVAPPDASWVIEAVSRHLATLPKSAKKKKERSKTQGKTILGEIEFDFCYFRYTRVRCRGEE